MSGRMAALGVLLLASLAGNAFVGKAYLEQRDRATAAEAHSGAANRAALNCSEGVASLRTTIDAERRAHQAELATARDLRKQKQGNATREMTRPPAVPGNACASAELENREWLQRRKGGG